MDLACHCNVRVAAGQREVITPKQAQSAPARRVVISRPLSEICGIVGQNPLWIVAQD
jgi:hypothetical protein